MPPLSPVTSSYLWAAVRCGGAPIEVVLGQKERRVGHVQDGVVHQYHLTEVKLVGETLAFGFVQNALVVVIPAKGEERRISKEVWSRGIKNKGKKEGEKEKRREGLIQCSHQGFVSWQTEKNK